MNTAEFLESLRIHPAVLFKPPIFRLPFPIRCANGAKWLVGQEVSGLAVNRNPEALRVVLFIAVRTNVAVMQFTTRLMLMALRGRRRELID